MAINREDTRLFASEIRMLERSKQEIADRRHDHCDLLHKYEELAHAYEDLLSFAIKATRIGDAQGNALIKRESKTKHLLDHSTQGFLTFGKSLLVHDQYSAACDRIFCERVWKKNIASLLGNDPPECRHYTLVFSSVLETGYDDRLAELPARIDVAGRLIDVEYRLLQRADSEYAILVVLTEVPQDIGSESQVKYWSEHDSLTSLYNRSYIDKVMPKMLQPSSLPLSILLLDMNALKLTNDVFGHHEGDRLIVKLAEVLKERCRPTDIVARWGGDEFVAVLPNTDESGCRRLAESIRKGCSKTRLEVIDLSVSIGSATVQTPRTNITQLFAVAENRMYKNKLLGNKNIRRNIVDKIESVLEVKGLVAPGHIDRVKSRVLAFAKALGSREGTIESAHLMLLASLHDAGKVAIPEDLLNKAGPLTAEERRIVNNYTEVGYRMAQSIGEPAVADGILGLREKWDGSGYPIGLKEERIPFISRLFALPEVFDVMTHDTPYRRAMSTAEALNEIRAQRGRDFDPALTDAFLATYSFSAGR